MKKRKVLSMVLAIMLIVSAIYVPLTTVVTAAGVADGNGFVIDGTVLTAYTGAGGDEVRVPETVTEIAQSVFKNKTNIKKLIIPYTVEVVNGASMLESSTIEEIVFEDAPDGVENKTLTLNTHTFNLSNGLKRIELPKRLANLPASAFMNCPVLETVTLKNDSMTFDSNAFDGARQGLVVYVSGKETTTYTNLAVNSLYSNISVLKEGTAYNNDLITDIDGNLVSCHAATENTNVVIPVGVTTVNKNAFSSTNAKKNVVSVTFPYTVTTVNQSIFEGCTAIKSVTFEDVPEEVTGDYTLTLSSYSLHLATSLEHIVLPARLATTAAGTFNGNTALKTVTFKGENTAFVTNTFSGAPTGVICYVPNAQCNTYTNLSANSYITDAKGVILKEGMAYDPDFTYDMNGVLTAYKGEGGDVVIPEGVTEISSHVFKPSNTPNCDSDDITSITIPYTVKKVGVSIVEECRGLKKITFASAPEGVTVDYTPSISSYAFQLCTSLEEIVLPSHAVSVGNGFVNNCTSMKSVTVNNGNTTFGTSAFGGTPSGLVVYVPEKDCTAYTTAVTAVGSLPISILKIGMQSDPNFSMNIDGEVTAYTGTEAEATIPLGATTIKDSAFKENTVLKKLTIPYTVTLIEPSIVMDTDVEEIIFQEAPAGEDANYPLRIQQYAFQKSAIEELTLPTRIATLDTNAFAGVTNLAKVRIKNDNFSFGANTFSANSYLAVEVNSINCGTYQSLIQTTGYGTKVYAVIYPAEVDKNFVVIDGVLSKYKGTDTNPTVPSTVKVIGQGAFKGTSVTKITVPYTVEEIQTSAFENCTNLTEIVFEDAPAGKEADYTLTIKAHAFNLSGITHVDLPTHLVKIGDFSFGGISNLKYISVRGANVEYAPTPATEYEGKCTYAFRGAGTVPVFFNSNAKETQAYTDFIKTVELSSGSTANYLQGSSVYCAFMENGDAKTAYDNLDPNFAINFATGMLSAYTGSDVEVTIPDEVKIIGRGTFKDNKTVTKIIVPYTVEEIQTSAFENCTNLTEIIFEDAPAGAEGNYSLTIKSHAFNLTGKQGYDEEGNKTEWIGGLTHIDLPTHLVKIGDFSLAGIQNLKYISVRGANIEYAPTPVKEYEGKCTYAFRGVGTVPVFFNRTATETQAFKDFNKTVEITKSDGKTQTVNYVQGSSVYFRFMDDNDAAAAYALMNPDFRVDGYGVLKKYVGTSAVATIPAEVVEVGNEAFGYNQSLQKVVIPNTLKILGTSAFFGCQNLTEVEFEDAPESRIDEFSLEIKSWAFQSVGVKTKDESGKEVWTGGITELNLPNYKLKLNGYCFGNMKNLKGIIMDSPNMEYVLDGDKNVSTAENPRTSAFRSIGSQIGAVPVFFHKEHINAQCFTDFRKKTANNGYFVLDYGTSVYFLYLEDDGTPDYSKIHPDYAVDGDGYMSKYKGNGGDIVIPYGVVEIDEHAFDSVRKANNITSVSFPLTLKKIGNVLFKGMSNIKSVTFNEGLEDVAMYAFQGTSITELTLPSTLNSLKAGAFGGMDYLEKITFYSRNMVLSEKIQPFGGKSVPNVYVISGTETHKSFRNLEGADGTKFTLKTIGSKEYPGFKIVNKVLKEYTGTETNIVIPEEVTKINPKVFQNNENIKSVVIPAGVLTVGDSAFEGCKNLESLTLNEGLQKIGNCAFKGTAIKTVVIPSTVKSISREAFGGTPLTDVYIYGYNTKLPTSLGYKGAFADVKELTIHAAHGSAAYDFATKFADKHGFKFQILMVCALGANGTEDKDGKSILFRTQTVAGDVLTIDGQEYQIIGRGGFIIPTDLIEEGTELTTSTPGIVRAKHTIIVAEEEGVEEYELTFEKIPSTASSRTISFRPFIKYKDAEGKDAYYYGNVISRSAKSMKAYEDGNH